MIRTSLFVFFAGIAWMSVGATASIDSQRVSETLLVSEDYDSADIGGVVYRYYTNLKKTVQSDPENARNQVGKAQFDTSGEKAGGHPARFSLNNVVGKIRIETKIRFEGAGGTYLWEIGSGNSTKVVLGMAGDGILGHRNTPKTDAFATIPGTRMPPNQWHSVRMILNTETEAYDLYLDDHKKTPEGGYPLRFASDVDYREDGISSVGIAYAGAVTEAAAIYDDDFRVTLLERPTNDRVFLSPAPPSEDVAPDNGQPIVFWTSDTVGPNQTLLMYGGNFSDHPTVEIARIKDSPVQSPRDGQPDLDSWHRVKVEHVDDDSLQIVVPKDIAMGVFAIRITAGRKQSKTVTINAPDIWWQQANEGDHATPGGWLRLFGKSLALNAQAAVLLKSRQGQVRLLTPKSACNYSLYVELPDDLPEGSYSVFVHNGQGGDSLWMAARPLEIAAAPTWTSVVFSVVDEGADATGGKDSSRAVRAALDKAKSNGGGIVYFPRGMYRITEPLTLPEYTVFKGQGRSLVNLFWPGRDTPLPALVRGTDHFVVEDLGLTTHGNHGDVIRGNSHFKVRNTIIRADAFYRHDSVGLKGGSYSGPIVNKPTRELGNGIVAAGDDVEITDNDIYATNCAFKLFHGRDIFIARNKISFGSGPAQVYGIARVIIEDNVFTGEGYASGIGLSLYYDAPATFNVYFGNNTFEKIFGGDREAITLDGHGTAYLGNVAKVEGTHVTLAQDTYWGSDHKDRLPRWNERLQIEPDREWHGITLFVLDGKGAGQYRNLTGCQFNHVRIDRPFDVSLDETSIVSIGKFNGRHIFVGNKFFDTGSTVQLYPPNTECIVAENEVWRGQSMNAGAHLAPMRNGDPRVEASWFNQFIGNVIHEGLGYEHALSLSIYGTNRLNDIPASRGNIVRGNVLMNNATIQIGDAVEDCVVEDNTIEKTDVAIRIRVEARDVTVRENHFVEVGQEVTR